MAGGALVGGTRRGGAGASFSVSTHHSSNETATSFILLTFFSRHEGVKCLSGWIHGGDYDGEKPNTMGHKERLDILP